MRLVPDLGLAGPAGPGWELLREEEDGDALLEFPVGLRRCLGKQMVSDLKYVVFLKKTHISETSHFLYLQPNPYNKGVLRLLDHLLEEVAEAFGTDYLHLGYLNVRCTYVVKH